MASANFVTSSADEPIAKRTRMQSPRVGSSTQPSLTRGRDQDVTMASISEVMASTSGTQAIDAGANNEISQAHRMFSPETHEKKQIYVSGTFFMSDGSTPTVNNWTNIPWEHMLFKNSRVTREIAMHYQRWRFVSVKAKFKNTGQMYSTLSGNGVTFAGMNQSSKMYGFLDTEYILGPTLASEWTPAQLDSHIESMANDGFDNTGAAIIWPETNIDSTMGSFGPTASYHKVVQKPANAGDSLEFEWSGTDKHWRSTYDLVSESDVNGSLWFLDFTAGGPSVTTTYQNAHIPSFRWDNFGCGIWSRALFGGIGAQKPYYTPVQSFFSLNGVNNLGTRVKAQTGPCVISDDEVSTSKYNSGFVQHILKNRIQVHDPIPSLFLGFQNQAGGATLTGLQIQQIQVQFELEVTIEVGGKYAVNRLRSFSTFNQQNSAVQALPYVLSNWGGHQLAIPMYPSVETGSTLQIKPPMRISDYIKSIVSDY